MLTLQWIELRCPVCESIFESMAAFSAHEPDRPYTDLAVPATEVAVLPYFVHVCRGCGYAGGVEDYGDGVEMTPMLRDRVWAELAPTLATSVRIPWLLLSVPGSEKYEGAARVAEWRGAEALTVADRWICAARCALDEGDHEAERYYARFAARWYAEALARVGELALETRAGITYRLGELWLRIGDVRQAAGWFRRVADEIIDPEAQRSVMEAARQQVEHPGGLPS